MLWWALQPGNSKAAKLLKDIEQGHSHDKNDTPDEIYARIQSLYDDLSLSQSQGHPRLFLYLPGLPVIERYHQDGNRDYGGRMRDYGGGMGDDGGDIYLDEAEDGFDIDFNEAEDVSDGIPPQVRGEVQSEASQQYEYDDPVIKNELNSLAHKYSDRSDLKYAWEELCDFQAKMMPLENWWLARLKFLNLIDDVNFAVDLIKSLSQNQIRCLQLYVGEAGPLKNQIVDAIVCGQACVPGVSDTGKQDKGYLPRLGNQISSLFGRRSKAGP
ncbi:hypothetical protein MP228_010711 [Amoeboaphelidium protococcarum]|nr:hypothetical protein MP228_010711 [Amoeboaphelidium protococcarum]